MCLLYNNSHSLGPFFADIFFNAKGSIGSDAEEILLSQRFGLDGVPYLFLSVDFMCRDHLLIVLVVPGRNYTVNFGHLSSRKDELLPSSYFWFTRLS